MTHFRHRRVLFRYTEGATIEAMPELRVISRGNRGQSHAVRVLAADQSGIVSRAQLLEAGVSRWAVDRALRSGTLRRLQRGVYSTVPPELLSADALLLSALFAAGPGAFLSHGTAAWRWRIISGRSFQTKT